jgi:hypothetical protein
VIVIFIGIEFKNIGCMAVANIPAPFFVSNYPMQAQLHILKRYSTLKGKAIPLQALTGPEGSKRLRLPDFETIGT